MHGTVQAQSALTNGLVLAAQQKMHIETGPGQHQPIKAANGATANDADARGVRMHANLQVKGQHSFYTGYVALGSPFARNTLAQVKTPQ
ncbi:hypothetical protein D3C75_1188720 [compost metagenome]